MLSALSNFRQTAHRKTFLIFPESRFWYFLQIVSNFHLIKLKYDGQLDYEVMQDILFRAYSYSKFDSVIALGRLFKHDAASSFHGGLQFISTITKTCLYNFDPLKPHFYIAKLGFTGVNINFSRNKKNIRIFYLKIFIYLVVKYSINLNRRVFVITTSNTTSSLHVLLPCSGWVSCSVCNAFIGIITFDSFEFDIKRVDWFLQKK